MRAGARGVFYWEEDARLERGDSVSDERIAALLKDARDFSAELDYARGQGEGT
ncbi:hypothetical protein [Massilia sp.]|uniref:hypothetical protein n=1 Tax=Massilia sp. TaxID=1882437 RepID=UPI0039187F4C